MFPTESQDAVRVTVGAHSEAQARAEFHAALRRGTSAPAAGPQGPGRAPSLRPEHGLSLHLSEPWPPHCLNYCSKQASVPCARPRAAHPLGQRPGPEHLQA